MPVPMVTMTMTTNSYSNCRYCLGRGGKRVAGRWIKCVCMRPTPAAIKAQRMANGAGAAYPDRDGIRRQIRGQLELPL